jgi:hypothetical protein
VYLEELNEGFLRSSFDLVGKSSNDSSLEHSIALACFFAENANATGSSVPDIVVSVSGQQLSKMKYNTHFFESNMCCNVLGKLEQM